jgi:hypothetical protein
MVAFRRYGRRMIGLPFQERTDVLHPLHRVG